MELINFLFLSLFILGVIHCRYESPDSIPQHVNGLKRDSRRDLKPAS